MSSEFGIYCDSCDEYGPWIRRSAGGTIIYGPDDLNVSAWLIEHEWCPKFLVHEAGEAGTMFAYPSNASERARERAGPLHLMPQAGVAAAEDLATEDARQE